ncbi:MAG: FhaA domain-containing protein [Nocardioidaceae bacterium]
MSALQRFEQRLEHAVTGLFARAFRSAVQPMEIAAALQREVDNSAQILSRDRRLAPNEFTIELSTTDFDRLSQYGETMASELAAMLYEHGQQQHYLFAGPIKLDFASFDDLTTGRFRVRSSAAAHVTASPGQVATDTAIRGATTWLEIAGTRTTLEPPGVTLGRGSQADIRVDDPGVSRRHIEIRMQTGLGAPTLSVVDLGSTNGTTVNGRRVQHAPLVDGDVVQVGATRIVIHVEPSAAASDGQPWQSPGWYNPQPDRSRPDRPSPYSPQSHPASPPSPQPQLPPPQPPPPLPHSPQPYHPRQPPYRMPDPPAAPAGPDHNHWSG